MAIMDTTISIEGYKGLYLKNTMSLNISKLTRQDYTKIKKEKALYFVMQTYKPKRKRLNLTPINLVGKTVAKAIAEADNERNQIIENMVNGRIDNTLVGKTTVKDLWEKFTAERLRSKTISENYVKTNTYLLKHLINAFMPYKSKKEVKKIKVKTLVSKNGKTEDKFSLMDFEDETPLLDKNFEPIVDNNKIVDIRDITADMMKEVYDNVLNGSYYRVRNNKKDGVYYQFYEYKPATAHQLKKVFEGMFKYAKEKNWIEINPFDDIKIAPYDNIRDFNLPKEKEKALYEALTNYYDIKFRCIFMFLLEGRRKNEALKLLWTDINFDEKTYDIRLENSKNDIAYTYIIPDRIYELLLILKQNPENALYSDKQNYVFKSSRTGLKIDNFDKKWNAIMKELDIEDVRRHDMRHWLGNTAINMGKTTAEVAAILGHSDERSAKRYGKVKSKTVRKAVDDVHSQIMEAD